MCYADTIITALCLADFFAFCFTTIILVVQVDELVWCVFIYVQNFECPPTHFVSIAVNDDQIGFIAELIATFHIFAVEKEMATCITASALFAVCFWAGFLTRCMCCRALVHWRDSWRIPGRIFYLHSPLLLVRWWSVGHRVLERHNCLTIWQTLFQELRFGIEANCVKQLVVCRNVTRNFLVGLCC